MIKRALSLCLGLDFLSSPARLFMEKPSSFENLGFCLIDCSVDEHAGSGLKKAELEELEIKIKGKERKKLSVK